MNKKLLYKAWAVWHKDRPDETHSCYSPAHLPPSKGRALAKYHARIESGYSFTDLRARRQPSMDLFEGMHREKFMTRWAISEQEWEMIVHAVRAGRYGGEMSGFWGRMEEMGLVTKRDVSDIMCFTYYFYPTGRAVSAVALSCPIPRYKLENQCI